MRGDSMYRAYGLLPPGSDFSLGEAFSRLQARFPGYSLTTAGDQITITKDDWEIELWLNTTASVLEEAVGLAEKIAGVGDGLDIESCRSRVEVWSDTPDPFLEHLSEFHAVIEVLRSFPGMILIDPKEPALI
jgi:hypothetical protein